jgi:hypothetical protein
MSWIEHTTAANLFSKTYDVSVLCLPVVLFVSGYIHLYIRPFSIHVGFDFLNTLPIKSWDNVAFPLESFLCILFSRPPISIL